MLCEMRLTVTLQSRYQTPLNAVSLSDFPIRKQHHLGGMAFGVALVRHPQIRPAHAIPARDETAEHLGIATLAADRDAPDAGLGRGRLDGTDRGIERGVVARGELQHADFI